MAYPNLSQIVATTLANRTKEVADNVTANNGVLRFISKAGNVKTFDGGRTIYEPFSFQENGNTGYYSGTDLLPTGATQDVTAAEFGIKQASTQVVVSGLEEIQNSGTSAIIDLLDARLEVAEQSLTNLLNRGVYSDGTGFSGKQITGLQAAVTSSPATGTYGGIDRSVWSVWRNKKFQGTVDGTGAVTSSNIIFYMDQLFANMVRGGDRPNVIIMDQTFWATYMNALQPQQRFTSSASADAGFQEISYMNIPVVLDNTESGVPSRTAYFLNTKFLKWRPYAGRNIVALDPKARFSVNQDAQTQVMVWAGNMTCSGLKFQGILTD